MNVRNRAFLATLLTAALSYGSLAPLAATACTTGVLRGIVRESDGAPVAGAVVTATSPAQVVHAVTDCNGFYSIVDVIPGTYRIVAEKNGFRAPAIEAVAVEAGSVTLADVRLARELRVVSIDGVWMSAPLVDSRQTADVYKINAHNNPLFSNAIDIGSLLQFVPGVQVGGGAAAIR